MCSKWNFLETPIQVRRGVSLLYFNSLFSDARFILRISQRPRYQVKTNKIVNIVFITTLVLQDWPRGYIFSYLYKLRRALSVSRMLVEISLKPAYSSMVEKNLKISVAYILENCIESRHFNSCLLSSAKILP